METVIFVVVALLLLGAGFLLGVTFMARRIPKTLASMDLSELKTLAAKVAQERNE